MILKPKAKGDDDKTPPKSKIAKKRRNSNRSPTPDDAALRNPDAKGRYLYDVRTGRESRGYPKRKVK